MFLIVSQRDTAEREALLRERRALYAKIQFTNMTHVVKAAERRLARLRLRSTWTALKVAWLSGGNIKLTRERDTAIQTSVEIRAKILLRAQQRSRERAHQVCGSVCAVMAVTPVLQHAAIRNCYDRSSTRCLLR